MILLRKNNLLVFLSPLFGVLFLFAEEAILNEEKASLLKFQNFFRGHQDGIPALALDPNGKFVATGGYDKKIRLWNSVNFKLVHTFHGHLGNITSLIFSKDGNFLISGSSDWSINIWDIKRKKSVAKLEGHNDIVEELALTKTGKHLISCSWDTKIGIWNMRTKKNIKMLNEHLGKVITVALAPEGRTFASAGVDKEIFLWEVKEEEEKDIVIKQIKKLVGHTEEIHKMAFHPKEDVLFSGDIGGFVYAWDLKQGKKVFSKKMHQNAITSLSFSFDGKNLLTGSLDKTLIIIDFQTKKTKQIIKNSTFIEAAIFSENGVWFSDFAGCLFYYSFTKSALPGKKSGKKRGRS